MNAQHILERARMNRISALAHLAQSGETSRDPVFQSRRPIWRTSRLTD